MNKKGREKIKKLKQKKEITYQEAWNKISEYMNKNEDFSFGVNPWNKKGENRYTLQTIKDMEYTEHFIAEQGWE